MFFAALFSLMLCALAGGDPALGGTWILSAAESDPVDALLEAQGVGWVERKAASSLAMTQTISIDEPSVTLAVVTAVKSETLTMTVDGQVRTVHGEHGASQVLHRWGEAGELITVSDGPSASGDAMHVEITRAVHGADTMHQRVEVTVGGRTIRVRRVFHRG